MKHILLLLLITGVMQILNAKDNIQKSGDVLAALLPLAAYSTSLYLDDKQGEYSFYKSYTATMATTYILKYTVREKRPDSDATDSFPSGHTASAFGGASFIHARYGIKYAVLPYLLAAFTAYSRVHTNRHHTHDVIAGAAIALASSWYFTDKYKNIEVIPVVANDFKGLTLSYKW